MGFVQAASTLRLQKTKNKTNYRVENFAPSRAVHWIDKQAFESSNEFNLISLWPLSKTEPNLHLKGATSLEALWVGPPKELRRVQGWKTGN